MGTCRRKRAEEREVRRKREMGAWGGKVEIYTLDTRGTGAVEGHSVAAAGATSSTGLRLADISSETLVALGATPARFTGAAEPEGGGSQGQRVGRD